MTIYIRWKKKIVMNLDEAEVEELGWENNEVYERVTQPFNCKITEFFQASDISELLDVLFARIKTNTENAKLPKSAFTLDEIEYLLVNLLVVECSKWRKSYRASKMDC